MSYKTFSKELQNIIDAHIILAQLHKPIGREHRLPLFDEKHFQKEQEYWAHPDRLWLLQSEKLKREIELDIAHYSIDGARPKDGIERLREEPQSKLGVLLDNRIASKHQTPNDHMRRDALEHHMRRTVHSDLERQKKAIPITQKITQEIIRGMAAKTLLGIAGISRIYPGTPDERTHPAPAPKGSFSARVHSDGRGKEKTAIGKRVMNEIVEAGRDTLLGGARALDIVFNEGGTEENLRNGGYQLYFYKMYEKYIGGGKEGVQSSKYKQLQEADRNARATVASIDPEFETQGRKARQPENWGELAGRVVKAMERDTNGNLKPVVRKSNSAGNEGRG